MNIKYHLLLLALAIGFTMNSCTEKESFDQQQGGVDLSRMELVAFDQVTVSEALDTPTRTDNVGTPMLIGSSFRLYAFERGKTDMADLLVTRTYTIKERSGVPVINGTEELYLPVGQVDIYLVGPLEVDINEGEYDALGDPMRPFIVAIATENGVSPHYAVDLIASKTELDIVSNKVNTFKANPLSHKMARMEVSVSRPMNPTYENLLVKEVSVYNQELTSTFTFGPEGGSIKPVLGTQTIITHRIDEKRKGDNYSATLYMIPRPEEEMKLEVRFTCNHIGQTQLIDKRLTSGLITAPLIAGKQNRFWSQPELSPNIIWRISLLPWNDVDVDEISVPSVENLLFSYSGVDAPMTINGKQYWRDRSGNGNHAEIVGDMKYDSVNRCYYNGAVGDSKFIIPALGQLNEYTLELAMQSRRSPQASTAYFSDDKFGGNRCLNIHLPWANNTIYFDTGSMNDARRVSDSYMPNDLYLMENFATYFFSRNTAKSVIGVNGNFRTMSNLTSTATSYGAFNYNTLWEASTTNDTFQEKQKMRLYAVRMYKAFTQGGDNTAPIQNREADLATFAALHTAGNDTKYVENGLILNLDGTIKGGVVAQWQDQSESKNHANIKGTVTYTSNKCFTFLGNIANYMELSRSLGIHQNYTIEFVALSSSSNTAQTSLFHFGPEKEDPNKRAFHVHYPWQLSSTTDGIYIDSPYNIPNEETVRINLKVWQNPEIPYKITAVNQWSVLRTAGRANGFATYMNSRFMKSATSMPTVPEMKYCYIGRHGGGRYAFQGQLYAVRVYNRPLSEKERQHNYLVDKKKYGILP